MSYQAFYSNLKPRKKSNSRVSTDKQPERVLGLSMETIIQHEKDPNIDDIIWCSLENSGCSVDWQWLNSLLVPVRVILLLGMAPSAGFFLNSDMFSQNILLLRHSIDAALRFFDFLFIPGSKCIRKDGCFFHGREGARTLRRDQWFKHLLDVLQSLEYCGCVFVRRHDQNPFCAWSRCFQLLEGIRA